MSLYRVLLVDDDSFYLKVHADFLHSRGFEVDTARDGESALSKVKDIPFNLVVCDLNMPGMTGLTLLERIRKQRPEQDVVVVSGSDDVRLAVRAMRLGAYTYLVKPVEPEELILVIDRLQERATLYEEHARLADQNRAHSVTQKVFMRALDVFSDLNLEAVCEQLLEVLSDVCRAQGAVTWVADVNGQDFTLQGYRGLVDAASLPLSWNLKSAELKKRLSRGTPLLCGKSIEDLAPESPPAAGLAVPLVRDGGLLGVIHLTDSLAGGFDTSHAAHARIVGEAGARAVYHARRARKLERVGLRDPESNAYNMTYFVDYLGRELHKSRRYRNNFSLVEVSLDNLESIRQAVRPETAREVVRQLVQSLESVLRDVDVLARVDDSSLYVLVSEADFLSSLNWVHAAREAVERNPFLKEIDEQHPLIFVFGPASFPRDGDDVDQLFAASRRRCHEARRSVYRRLHLHDLDFWDAVDALVGNAGDYDSIGPQDTRILSSMEDERGLSRRFIFNGDFTDAISGGILSEALRQSSASGWLYLGGAWSESRATRVRGRLEQLGQTQFRTYLLGATFPRMLHDLPHVAAVAVGGRVFEGAAMTLMLGEHTSYASFVRRGEKEHTYGFHSADWTLVDAMVHKLQNAYSLQRGTA